MKSTSLIERMKERIVLDGECWVWTGPPTPLGYRQISLQRRLVYTHRAVYELLVGPIPEGLTLDHLCRNPPCVNPAHLEPVTNAENIRRGISPPGINSRRLVCKSGHPFDDANTYIRPDGYRECRKCHCIRDVARCKELRRLGLMPSKAKSKP